MAAREMAAVVTRVHVRAGFKIEVGMNVDIVRGVVRVMGRLWLG
jgi:hypothetical protein